jgi:ABC-type amino acid transport system permease subunit
MLINVNGFRANNATKQLSSGVLTILLDQLPRLYEKSKEVYLAVGSAILPCLVALLWIGWSIFRFIRRGKRVTSHRRGFMWWAFVIVLPLLLDLALLGILLKGIPTVWQLPLNGFAQMFPDFYTLIILSAIALIVWVTLGTYLTFKQSRATC